MLKRKARCQKSLFSDWKHGRALSLPLLCCRLILSSQINPNPFSLLYITGDSLRWSHLVGRSFTPHSWRDTDDAPTALNNWISVYHPHSFLYQLVSPLSISFPPTIDSNLGEKMKMLMNLLPGTPSFELERAFYKLLQLHKDTGKENGSWLYLYRSLSFLVLGGWIACLMNCF